MEIKCKFINDVNVKKYLIIIIMKNLQTKLVLHHLHFLTN